MLTTLDRRQARWRRQDVDYLSDGELLERGFYRLVELHRLGKRARRIGATVNVRVAAGTDGRERYVYTVRGRDAFAAATASTTIEEAEQDISDLEGHYISERTD